jgi:ParB-like chromosome segregation protein Spo0J
MRRKLTAYLRREGLVEPLVVRAHPKESGKYQLLGGYHRWQSCKDELGFETVPCVVVEGLDDKRAKILSINLNSMSGQPVPSLLSELLNDLQHGMPLDDMAATLPYDQDEIVDFLSLLQIPEGFADALEEEADEQDAAAPHVLTIVLDAKQAMVWKEAVEKAADEVGGTRNPKARTLELIAARYVSKSQRTLSSEQPRDEPERDGPVEEELHGHAGEGEHHEDAADNALELGRPRSPKVRRSDPDGPKMF